MQTPICWPTCAFPISWKDICKFVVLQMWRDDLKALTIICDVSYGTPPSSFYGKLCNVFAIQDCDTFGDILPCPSLRSHECSTDSYNVMQKTAVLMTYKYPCTAWSIKAQVPCRVIFNQKVLLWLEMELLSERHKMPHNIHLRHQRQNLCMHNPSPLLRRKNSLIVIGSVLRMTCHTIGQGLLGIRSVLAQAPSTIDLLAWMIGMVVRKVNTHEGKIWTVSMTPLVWMKLSYIRQTQSGEGQLIQDEIWKASHIAARQDSPFLWLQPACTKATLCWKYLLQFSEFCVHIHICCLLLEGLSLTDLEDHAITCCNHEQMNYVRKCECRNRPNRLDDLQNLAMLEVIWGYYNACATSSDAFLEHWIRAG